MTVRPDRRRGARDMYLRRDVEKDSEVENGLGSRVQ